MTDSSSSSSPLPFRAIVAVGTYDGVLAGWEIGAPSNSAQTSQNNTTKPKSKDHNTFQIAFASPVHGGSVRSLAMSSNSTSQSNTTNLQLLPGSLISCGYDETVRTHDFSKRLTCSGEVRTPAEYGTPVCSSFAPPPVFGCTTTPWLPTTHCLVGFSGGPLVIYKKRDWSVQHVLVGHEGGIASLQVHPSGKLALTGGTSDGKLKLWDLTAGRLAYASRILHPAAAARGGRTPHHYDPIQVVWNAAGTAYAFAYGTHVTVRAVDTGDDLLDVELESSSRVNQICFLQKGGLHGRLFVAVACNDGSLPVLAVSTDHQQQRVVRAVMAIEPIQGPVAGEERFKCIQSLMEYHVVTANSAGVVSLMNLRGAVQMILQEEAQEAAANGSSKRNEQEPPNDNNNNNEEEEEPVHPESDDDDDDNGEVDLAVDIVDSVCLGTGARITCLTCWCAPLETDDTVVEKEEDDPNEANRTGVADEEQPHAEESPSRNKRKSDAVKVEDESPPLSMKRKRDDKFFSPEVVMDHETVERARKLVVQAKKIQKRKETKKNKKLKPSQSR